MFKQIYKSINEIIKKIKKDIMKHNLRYKNSTIEIKLNTAIKIL